MTLLNWKRIHVHKIQDHRCSIINKHFHWTFKTWQVTVRKGDYSQTAAITILIFIAVYHHATAIVYKYCYDHYWAQDIGYYRWVCTILCVCYISLGSTANLPSIVVSICSAPISEIVLRFWQDSQQILCLFLLWWPKDSPNM